MFPLAARNEEVKRHIRLTPSRLTNGTFAPRPQKNKPMTDPWFPLSHPGLGPPLCQQPALYQQVFSAPYF
jgi:hypothetical protein